MVQNARILAAACLFAAGLLAVGLAGNMPALAEGPSVPKPAVADPRAVLRAQVESELAHRRTRLKLIEAELQKQSKRYDEMAAQKMELAKMAAAKQEATRAAATEKAEKAQLAAAKAGSNKAPPPRGGAAKPAKAQDAKAGGKDAPKDAGAGGAKPAAEAGAPKRIDPMLTQNYLVLRLRDEARHMRERIYYLEGVLARL